MRQVVRKALSGRRKPGFSFKPGSVSSDWGVSGAGYHIGSRVEAIV